MRAPTTFGSVGSVYFITICLLDPDSEKVAFFISPGTFVAVLVVVSLLHDCFHIHMHILGQYLLIFSNTAFPVSRAELLLPAQFNLDFTSPRLFITESKILTCNYLYHNMSKLTRLILVMNLAFPFPTALL